MIAFGMCSKISSGPDWWRPRSGVEIGFEWILSSSAILKVAGFDLVDGEARNAGLEVLNFWTEAKCAHDRSDAANNGDGRRRPSSSAARVASKADQAVEPARLRRMVSTGRLADVTTFSATGPKGMRSMPRRSPIRRNHSLSGGRRTVMNRIPAAQLVEFIADISHAKPEQTPRPGREKPDLGQSL